ncbi:MAG: hypothetical protein LBI62_08925 [Candidatus Accumulibacter sp.]|nr:hypothetical protein [Accumulibacter sp.]
MARPVCLYLFPTLDGARATTTPATRTTTTLRETARANSAITAAGRGKAMKTIEAGENIAGGDEKMRRDGLETNIGKKAIHQENCMNMIPFWGASKNCGVQGNDSPASRNLRHIIAESPAI